MTLDQVLVQARKLAETGCYDEAYELVNGLSFELASQALERLRMRYHAALTQQLRERFPDLGVYPQRLDHDQDLRKFNLKAREAFILGLIDGSTSLEDILAISPVDEFDSLRAVARLCDLQLLGVGPRV